MFINHLKIRTPLIDSLILVEIIFFSQVFVCRYMFYNGGLRRSTAEERLGSNSLRIGGYFSNGTVQNY